MKQTIALLGVCFCWALTTFAEPLAPKISDSLVKITGDQFAPATDALSGKSIIAVYYSAHWCPPCRAFTPKLVDFYNKFSAKNPNFQLVFVSADHGQDGMLEYMKSAKMPWPAVQYEQVQTTPLLSYAASTIPFLVVLDAEGNKILGKVSGFQGEDPNDVLEQLSKKLKK